MNRSRQITYVQKGQTIAHRWGADLAHLRWRNKEIALMEEDLELARRESARYREYLELCNTIIDCRTSRGKVGVQYPILMARLQNWVVNYPMSQEEWQGIKRCMKHHSTLVI